MFFDFMDAYAYQASQAAYGNVNYHNKLLQSGFMLDSQLSQNNVRVYAKNNKALIAFRGTNPNNLFDLHADKDIFFGTQNASPQFAIAKHIARKTKQKYGTILLTGHSLGGTKAIEAANYLNVRAVVFNPGTGIIPLKTRNHKVYRTDNDIISQRVFGNNVQVLPGTHSLNSFEKYFNKS